MAPPSGNVSIRQLVFPRKSRHVGSPAASEAPRITELLCLSHAERIEAAGGGFCWVEEQRVEVSAPLPLFAHKELQQPGRRRCGEKRGDPDLLVSNPQDALWLDQSLIRPRPSERRWDKFYVIWTQKYCEVKAADSPSSSKALQISMKRINPPNCGWFISCSLKLFINPSAAGCRLSQPFIIQ